MGLFSKAQQVRQDIRDGWDLCTKGEEALARKVAERQAKSAQQAKK